MVREVIVLAAEDSNSHRLFGEASPVIASILRELWPQSTNCISNIMPKAKSILGPASNEFGYKRHRAITCITSKYLRIKIIYNNGWPLHVLGKFSFRVKFSFFWAGYFLGNFYFFCAILN